MRHAPPQKKPHRRPRPVNKVDWEEEHDEHENPDWLVGAN